MPDAGPNIDTSQTEMLEWLNKSNTSPFMKMMFSVISKVPPMEDINGTYEDIRGACQNLANKGLLIENVRL